MRTERKNKVRKSLWATAFAVLSFFVFVGCKNAQANDETGGNVAEEETYYTVIFMNDGSAAQTQRVKKGGKVTRPETPQKESGSYFEYEFCGWYAGGEEWNFEEDRVNGDLTLEAAWRTSAEYTGGYEHRDL